MLICGSGYINIIDAVITEDSRCQYEESILFVVQYKHLLWPPSIEWLHFLLRLWHVTQAAMVVGNSLSWTQYQKIRREKLYYYYG